MGLNIIQDCIASHGLLMHAWLITGIARNSRGNQLEK